MLIASTEDNDSPEDSAEDGLRRKLPEEKEAPLTWRDHLGNLFVLPGTKKVKKKDKVDEIVEQIEKEEDDKIEDLVLTDMASDPDDLTFALKDLKVRGLKKTMSKMAPDSKKEYISKCGRAAPPPDDDEPHPEDDYSMERQRERYEGSEEEYDEGSMPMHMRHEHDPRHEYPDSASGEDERLYYDPRELTRGGYPPPPPTPPTPLYGREAEEMYESNLKMLDQNLAAADYLRRRLGSRRERNMGGADRGYLQRKRNEAAEAKNVFDKTRVAAEIGAETRSSRQCRAFFRECPVKTIAKSPGEGGDAENADTQPFLNRAVNNIRRVLLGGQPQATKQRRVNEIKEAIQQLNPPRNHGGSEVKVVLNIGPTPPDLHRAGVVMQQYGQPVIPTPDPMMITANGVSPQVNMMPQVSMMPQVPPSPAVVMVNGQQLATPPSPYMTQMNPPGPTQLYPATSATPPKLPSMKPTTFHDMLTNGMPKKVIKTTPKPGPSSTRKTMVYHNPSAASKTVRPSTTSRLPSLTVSTPSSVEFDSLEQLLKTTLPPENEETTEYPSFDETNGPGGLFSDEQEEEEEEERVQTLDDLLPSKRPISKEEYAQNLRETLSIFDRFKQANKNKTQPTTVKTTAKPRETAQRQPASNKKVKKFSNNRVASANNSKKQTAKGKGSQKQVAKGSKKQTGKGSSKKPSKGESEDIPQEDIYEILDFLKLVRKRNRDRKGQKKANKGHKGKGKGTKKGGDDSSEESSEEEYYSEPPLVAVPPPTDKFKVMWKPSSSILKDGTEGSPELLIAMPKESQDMSEPQVSFLPHELENGRMDINPDSRYYDSMELGSYEINNADSNEPELVYSPFSQETKSHRASSSWKSNRSRRKKKRGSVKRIGETSKGSMTTTTTTAKPKRRVLNIY
ncbi:hypothetical protein Ocin01_12261 [Orchesella cincta]|uniref:Uncharacterized protein n=1 Tax=Orchesella cincta TaxID=48709 RepID=A0A1D2MMZ4_ORCCI|nr:hypothetical protein Ocin01_12261 [Orchesella cincta]